MAMNAFMPRMPGSMSSPNAMAELVVGGPR